MMDLAFQIPWALAGGVCAVVAVLTWFGWALHRSGLSGHRIAILLTLRFGFLAVLVLLAARPVWRSSDDDREDRDGVALLIDCSQSMGVSEGELTRYEQAVGFARETVLPMVDQSRLTVQPLLFDGEVRQASGAEIAAAVPEGGATNLGGAIVHSVLGRQPPPRVAIALTDGIVTTPVDHSRAIAALLTNGVPLVAIGFGSETGGQVITLDEIDAPAIVEPQQRFSVAARLRASGDVIPAFDLLWLRDGKLIDRRSVEPTKGPRTWIESYEVASDTEGLHVYSARLMPPSDRSVTVSNAEAAALVRVAASSELRVLYVQGGLTWDYKFVTIAISGDPTIRLSGLSRTSNTSKFFENVQSDLDLADGFPSTLEKLNEFRVVVLSNLRPGDLTPKQQQLLADYCGELGGGVLMIGGPHTFNASWRDSRLEELLPVGFAVLPSQSGDSRFRIQLTDTGLTHPVFQISDKITSRAAWAKLPPFTNRAIVERVKPGAEVWLESSSSKGLPVLMASQRYGNGVSSVICMQNLWRWRLARETEPDHFDRFWRQLFRYLADPGRSGISLTVSDPQPVPGDEIQLVLERRVSAGESSMTSRRVRLRVRDPQQRDVLDLPLDLGVGDQVPARFTADAAGMYTATVLGAGDVIVASRRIEVRDLAAELASTTRNMETLRQFAGISGGVAVEAETEEDMSALLKRYLDPDEPPKLELNYATPAGVNGWMLLILLLCISAEWLCRKRWGMLE